jgi:hypothetical protein
VTTGWRDLIDELDRWEEAGRVATLWWRDDDAVAPSAALDRLLSINETIPIALAVIPAPAEPELALWLSHRTRLHDRSHVAVLQHGWRHLSHAGNGKKSEFPPGRAASEVALELGAGRARLLELFGPRALPVLVPPWNRFDDSFLPLLGGCGLSAISRATPRRTTNPTTGVIEANIHVDLVAWSDGRGFIGEESALRGLMAHLQARRLNTICSAEPTGLLTHHLVQRNATEEFLHRLFEMTDAHPTVAVWLDAAKAFSQAESSAA